jgi:hypothetical protein
MKLPVFRLAIVFGLIFLGGTLCGVTGSYFFIRHRLKQAFHASPALPGYADKVATRLQNKWVRELGLDASQAEMVHGELATTAHDIKQLRFTTVSRFEELCREALKRIESKLPEEKRNRFHALAEAASKHWDIPLDSPQKGEKTGQE